MDKGRLVHEAPTIWGLGMVDIRSFTLANGKAVYRFELMTLRSQGNNFTVAPIWILITLKLLSRVLKYLKSSPATGFFSQLFQP